MPNPANVYDAFIDELGPLEIRSDLPAARVVGILTRAVKRAQLVIDGELPPIAERWDRARDYIR